MEHYGVEVEYINNHRCGRQTIIYEQRKFLYKRKPSWNQNEMDILNNSEWLSIRPGIFCFLKFSFLLRPNLPPSLHPFLPHSIPSFLQSISSSIFRIFFLWLFPIRSISTWSVFFFHFFFLSFFLSFSCIFSSLLFRSSSTYDIFNSTWPRTFVVHALFLKVLSWTLIFE